jgi:hypothetical protein
MNITHENLHIFTVPKEMNINHSFKEYFNIPIRIEQHPQTLLMSIVITDKDLEHECDSPKDFIEHVTRQYGKYLEDIEKSNIKHRNECKVIYRMYKDQGITNEELFKRLENIPDDVDEKEESLTDLIRYAKSFLDDIDIEFESDEYSGIIGRYQDCEDVLEVAHHFNKGNFKKACKKASSLDTFVREGIPDSTWDFLQKEAKEWK